MSVHYKYPILLIEFEEHKSFSLEVYSSILSYLILCLLQNVADINQQTAKYRQASKYAKSSASAATSGPDGPPTISIQAKLVLLTLTFPRLRIIWSSSPHASSEIFKELKINQFEPDLKKALLIGSEEDQNQNQGGSSSMGNGRGGGEGVNVAAEDLLRTFPGVTSKNVRYVMRRVGSVRELCEMSVEGVQEILGSEPGKACWEFLHRRK